MFWHRWARRDLQRGDLNALLELTNDGRWDYPDPARLQRLNERGFIKTRKEDKLQVTMKGRAALVLGGKRNSNFFINGNSQLPCELPHSSAWGWHLRNRWRQAELNEAIRREQQAAIDAADETERFPAAEPHRADERGFSEVAPNAALRKQDEPPFGLAADRPTREMKVIKGGRDEVHAHMAELVEDLKKAIADIEDCLERPRHSHLEPGRYRRLAKWCAGMAESIEMEYFDDGSRRGVDTGRCERRSPKTGR
jgi:hypothetical protein